MAITVITNYCVFLTKKNTDLYPTLLAVLTIKIQYQEWSWLPLNFAAENL